MTFENLLVTDAGPVRTITLNRPKALNALNQQTLAELAVAIAEVAKSSSVRVLVLTGAGEKSFVAGAGITEMKDATPPQGAAMSKMGHDVLFALQALAIPVIAAVNGFALGGGLELALACDFIIASDNARLGLVETNLGLIPGFGGIARLQRRVGPGHASEMIFSAAQLDSTEALRIGLVNKVVPLSELIPTVTKIAEAIAHKGPYAISLAKRLLVEGSDADARTAHAMEQVSFGLVFASADKIEGVGAFLEKRKPTFQGK
jgi:enoyl-CoA hydratase